MVNHLKPNHPIIALGGRGQSQSFTVGSHHKSLKCLINFLSFVLELQKFIIVSLFQKKTKTTKLNVKQKELLITEVQKRPLLHDLKNTGYKNTQLKAKEWAIDGDAVGEIPG